MSERRGYRHLQDVASPDKHVPMMLEYVLEELQGLRKDLRSLRLRRPSLPGVRYYTPDENAWDAQIKGDQNDRMD
jgi:hypothetical protein